MSNEPLPHLPESCEHVPVPVFNALVDVVNSLCNAAELVEEALWGGNENDGSR